MIQNVKNYDTKLKIYDVKMTKVEMDDTKSQNYE